MELVGTALLMVGAYILLGCALPRTPVRGHNMDGFGSVYEPNKPSRPTYQGDVTVAIACVECGAVFTGPDAHGLVDLGWTDTGGGRWVCSTCPVGTFPDLEPVREHGRLWRTQCRTCQAELVTPGEEYQHLNALVMDGWRQSIGDTWVCDACIQEASE